MKTSPKVEAEKRSYMRTSSAFRTQSYFLPWARSFGGIEGYSDGSMADVIYQSQLAGVTPASDVRGDDGNYPARPSALCTPTGPLGWSVAVRGLRRPQTTIDASSVVDLSAPMCSRPSHEQFFRRGGAARFAMMSSVEMAATEFNDSVGRSCSISYRTVEFDLCVSVSRLCGSRRKKVHQAQHLLKRRHYARPSTREAYQTAEDNHSKHRSRPKASMSGYAWWWQNFIPEGYEGGIGRGADVAEQERTALAIGGAEEANQSSSGGIKLMRSSKLLPRFGLAQRTAPATSDRPKMAENEAISNLKEQGEMWLVLIGWSLAVE
ncbi:hypothetical protein THAOC_34856 [Thalassiosira oceanica]|uniref:Uncharacterized protein n=1 Tax=Thalassiosira oceanica TaxID=159749 RepID=K0R1U4_THAOC|nr:hypothetical protein THAOC_34856 [Thalassiosira oceanica]|eukprot:EJK46473.1 hypothetical protein THAOC_34856 [Thalassiosira oceanica]